MRIMEHNINNFCINLLITVPPLELFRGAALSLTCSIASKCVGLDELGIIHKYIM